MRTKPLVRPVYRLGAGGDGHHRPKFDIPPGEKAPVMGTI